MPFIVSRDAIFDEESPLKSEPEKVWTSSKSSAQTESLQFQVEPRQYQASQESGRNDQEANE